MLAGDRAARRQVCQGWETDSKHARRFSYGKLLAQRGKVDFQAAFSLPKNQVHIRHKRDKFSSAAQDPSGTETNIPSTIQPTHQ